MKRPTFVILGSFSNFTKALLFSFDFLKFRSMYTDADKHLKDFNALNQYQQEEQEEDDIWGEESGISEEADEEEILLISDDFVISEEDYIHKKSNEI